MRGHVSPVFLKFFSLCTTVFVILLQFLRELKFGNNNVVIIQVKASEFATYSKTHFAHLQQ